MTHGRGVRGSTITYSESQSPSSMARSMRMDSAGSQFFIMVADAPHLDGSYAAFGKVLTGMEAADQIVSARRNNADRPFEDQVIQSIRVETYGVEYPFTRLKQ